MLLTASGPQRRDVVEDLVRRRVVDPDGPPPALADPALEGHLVERGAGHLGLHVHPLHRQPAVAVGLEVQRPVAVHPSERPVADEGGHRGGGAALAVVEGDDVLHLALAVDPVPIWSSSWYSGTWLANIVCRASWSPPSPVKPCSSP
jgi:hypothetical protein